MLFLGMLCEVPFSSYHLISGKSVNTGIEDFRIQVGLVPENVTYASSHSALVLKTILSSLK